MSQYVSIKDDTTKMAVQPKRWTLLRFTTNGKTVDTVTPIEDAYAHFAWYLNVADTADAKRLSVRFSRDPKGVNDFTGEHFMDLTIGTRDSHTWFFKGRKGQPVGVMVYHDGSKPITLATRELKLWAV